MSQTQATLITQVLQDLGAIGAGVSPEAADSTAVADRLAPIYADLAARRIYTVANTDALEDRAYPSLLRIVVETLAPTFGRPTNAEVVAAAETALAAFTRYSATDRTSLALAVLERLGYLADGTSASTSDLEALDNIVTPVLADLAARRITPTLTPASIPDKYWNDILAICVEMSRERFSRITAKPEISAAIITAAEKRLYSITRLDRTDDAFAIRVLELLDVWGATNPAIDATAIEATYQGILDDLAARNIIYVADIDTAPESVKHHLVRIIAAQFLPQADITFVEHAERMLRKQQRAGQRTRQVIFPVDVLFQRGRRY